MKTWKIGLIAASTTILGGLSSAVLWNGIAHGEWDFPGLQQQVQHVTEVTDNHEGRITNLEGKVNTPSDQPTPTPAVVTKIVTQAAPQTAAGASTTPTAPVVEATPTPAPTVTSSRHINCYDNTTDPYSYRQAIFTQYSDGSGSMTNPDGSPYTYHCQLAPGSW